MLHFIVGTQEYHQLMKTEEFSKLFRLTLFKRGIKCKWSHIKE